ncbi:hypothetical protein D3C80_1832470 [compost metagenome]
MVLAANSDLAHPRAKPDKRLPTEQAAALLHGAGIAVKATFQNEDRLQPAAQVFRAAQAPT